MAAFVALKLGEHEVHRAGGDGVVALFQAYGGLSGAAGAWGMILVNGFITGELVAAGKHRRGGAMALKQHTLETDFLVAGGGLAGVCAAIASARRGSRVVHVRDTPYLRH
jgi:hypothetical protein